MRLSSKAQGAKTRSSKTSPTGNSVPVKRLIAAMEAFMATERADDAALAQQAA